jgi:hypothetical protein
MNAHRAKVQGGAKELQTMQNTQCRNLTLIGLGILFCYLWSETNAGAIGTQAEAAGTQAAGAGTQAEGTKTQADRSIAKLTPIATLSYAQDRLNFVGINASTLKLKQSGLEAEILARRNGIEALQDQLSKNCAQSGQMSGLKSAWQDSVKSLGSEVFADHTFKIILAGNLSDFIENPSSSSEIVSTDSKQVIFRMPSLVPLNLTRCGALSLQLPEGKSISVFPVRYQKPKASENYVSISLALSKSGSLYPAGSSDKENAKQSNLEMLASQFQSKVLSLPVVP